MGDRKKFTECQLELNQTKKIVYGKLMKEDRKVCLQSGDFLGTHAGQEFTPSR